MVKIKCEICKAKGTLQKIGNNYYRIRHYDGVDPETRKLRFHYHQQTKEYAEKQLQKIGSKALENTIFDQNRIGQKVNIDHKQNKSSLKHVMAGPVGFEPTTFSLEGHPDIDLQAYREYLDEKYSRQYSCLMFGYFRKYNQCFSNPNELLKIPSSIRSNVMKAMVCYSKYTSSYEDCKAKLKNSGIRWNTNDTAFNSFLRIVNNNHSDLGQWYNEMQNILRDNEKLFLKFALVTGLRKAEAIKSFNLIIKLHKEGKLHFYYRRDILEHFRFPELFFRKTKMTYISIVSEELVSKIAHSKSVSYFAIRKRIVTHNQTVRIKELRSYFATYLRQHGILAEILICCKVEFQNQFLLGIT